MAPWLNMIMRKGDTAQDIRIKKLGLPVCVFLVVIAGTTAFRSVADSSYMWALGAFLCTCGPLAFITGVVLTSVKAGILADTLLLVNTVGLCVLDVGAAAFSYPFRSWSFVVLILDAALVFDRQHIPKFVIPWTLLYIAAESLESVQRYGLYSAGYWGTDPSVSMCACASPPCSMSPVSGGISFLSVCSVFLFDFHFTRNFATSMRRQFRRMEVSVAVASEIAAALARYDVDVAEEAITGSGDDLPEDLAKSFFQLLSNLRSYKAYLPHSCLVVEEAPCADDPGDVTGQAIQD
eukprot:Hpha_TRINITY_DN16679_c2_g6::TRINITY_DN16679_c2_g6_i2::g.181100::m.181100